MLPDFLQPFRTKAQAYLKNNLIGDIEFSGGTYQVQVKEKDSDQEVWAFLQLDNRGQIKDCFCSCEEGEELVYCAHIAAAFLRIYNHESSPLHQRFQRSLWNNLCQLYADRMGDNPNLLESIKPGHYYLTSAGGKIVFYIEGKTSETRSRLKEILLHRKKQTEETSLKFSNLSQEELNLWREGRPSAQLRYELSFWNDIAHWLMQLQEVKSEYEIQFHYSANQLPNQIEITFADLKVSFYISEANLPHIIPSLTTVESPVPVHHVTQEAIDRIVYDKKTGSLLIEAKSKKKQGQARQGEVGKVIDGWLYVPKKGFFALDRHQLLASQKLSGDQVAQALNEHFPILQQLLEGASLHTDSVPLSYTLTFDAQWNLHIVGYLFAPGDLSAPGSRFFGGWVYLDDDGFYPVEEAHFGVIDKMVPVSEVEDFVRHERSWLNMQEGFHTHLASIEAQLSYTLSQDNRLSFSRLVVAKDREQETHDFGAWVYVAGKGFYSKVSTHTSLPVRADISISADQIPFFIRMNQGELQLVPDFFSKTCPVVKARLNITLNQEELVTIIPEYDLLPEYLSKDVRFFEEYVYVAGEGFSELPMEHRLPERFRHSMQIDPENVPLFLSYELEALTPYAANIDQRLIKPQETRLVAQRISKSGDNAGYVLKLGYETERGFISISTLWWATRKKKRFLFSEAGCLDISDKRFDWVKVISKARIDRRSNNLQLNTLELIRLNALDEIETKDEASQALLRDLTDFHVPEEPNITGLTSHLRTYQQLGVHWLWFLYQYRLSGMLCDEMGLGKTHQAMALLAAVTNENIKLGKQSKKAPLHFLIVCPTSVIYHWQEKLQAFLPHLRVCTFHGSTRSLEDFHHQYDILLTSYGIWRLENELLSQVSFEVAIFDEVQIAKNHNSRIHSSLLTVDAKMRIGLTGTPIENHLRELKALFDIIVPSYMPGDADYREQFVKPIEKENDERQRALLKRFIRPFMMRRKKADVLTDLPEKTEEISHCVLSVDQQNLYTEALRQSRERLLQQLHDQSNPIPYIHIFALLSNLKQICNHPAVYLKSPLDYKKYESGKWDLFVELFSEARESQQKIVVFSQYLTMLDIFEDYLNEIGVGFATIRGSTTDRGEQVHRFNHDPKCEVFLGSLLAAGLGVDLTAGSVVIHYDRWWNAAREDQATDRVHRIGQTRGVQVFKLVTKGTFEERIDLLITQKARLLEEVVTPDDHRFMKHFTRDELIQLLQDVEVRDKG